jgi:hypothetical protein
MRDVMGQAEQLGGNLKAYGQTSSMEQSTLLYQRVHASNVFGRE